jgi:fibronectin-binding autotransporter adhesin
MHNPGYRVQTTCLGRIGGFFVDYYLGPYMGLVPPSPFAGEDIRWSGTNSIWDVNTTQSWHTNNTLTTFQQGSKVLFDQYGLNGTISNSTVLLQGTLTPEGVAVYSGIDYTFAGTGSLTGTMQLVKTGKGTLTINNANSFTGATNIWDGALLLNNSYSSPVTVFGGTWGGINSKGNEGGRLGGQGTLAANLTVEEKGAIIPGTGMGSTGTLTVLGNVVFNKASYCGFDISATPGEAKDLLLITGNLTITDTISLYINLLDGTPATGDYPLIQYTGSFSGNLSAIRIVGLDVVPCSLYHSGNTIGFRVFGTRMATDIVWAGTSPAWDMGITQNWLNNSVADVFAVNDRVTFSDAGATQLNVLIKSFLSVGGLNVISSKDYTFSGNGFITGSTGLTKSGTGKLSISTNNTFTGVVSLTGGTTEINSINNKGLPGCFGASTAGINIDGGTLRVATSQVNTDRNIIIGASGAIFDIADSRFQLILNGQVSGSGAIIKIGAGALLLSAANTFNGGITINEGDVSLVSATGNSSGPGSGNVTLNGGSLNMGDVRQSEIAGWNIIVPEGKTAGLFTDGRCSLTGTLTGSGTLNIMIPYVRSDFKGDWSAFTGTINIVYDPHYTPDFRISNSYGYSQASFNLSQAAAMYRVGTGTTTVGAVSGVSGSELATKDESSRTSNWIIGTKNTNSTFAGIISGPGSITKSGTGIWTLSGKIKHSGSTSVNGGTLMVTADSVKGSSAVIVNNGGTLAGSPFITGSVTVNSGGIISPGNSQVQTGTMKLLNSLILNSGSTTIIKINRLNNLQDSLRVSGNVTFGGTLNIQLLAGSYNAGNAFKIVKASSYAGSFSDIAPSTPGPNLVWDLSTFQTDGTVRIKGTQTIGFNTLPSKGYGDNPFALVATGGGSGNPVTFTSSNTSVATISGNILTIKGGGTSSIKASQAGNNNYQAAADVIQTFTALATGIIDTEQKLKVYPNPVSGILYINNNGDTGTFRLYTNTGIRIKSGEISKTTELDLESLAPGLYNLQVIISNEASVADIEIVIYLFEV